MPDIAALILAAGGSTRMGRRKQLLQFQGQTFLKRAARAVTGAGFTPTVVVLGCEAEKMSLELADLANVQIVENTGWERGIGSSIREGMTLLLESNANVSAVLIMLADQPLITAETLARMSSEFARSGMAVCASSYSNTVGPPVIVSRLFFSNLLALPDAQGAKRIWIDHPDALALFSCEEASFDVDTPADFERLTSES